MSSYLKTKETNKDVLKFLHGIKNEEQRNDAFQILNMMQEVTKLDAKMWGASMIGFGKYSYKTKAGKVGEWFLMGFSPRKNNISLHLMSGLEAETVLLNKLGKHTLGKGCLYLKKLSDVQKEILRELINNTYQRMKQNTN